MSSHINVRFTLGSDVHRGKVVASSGSDEKPPIVTAMFGSEFGAGVGIISYDAARLARLLRQMADATEAAAVQNAVTGEIVHVELTAEAVPA